MKGTPFGSCRSTSQIGAPKARPGNPPGSARRRRSTRRCGSRSSPTSTTASCSQQSNEATWFLDPDIQFPNPGNATNAEPLLVNTAGSVGQTAQGGHADSELFPRVRLRSDQHRPGDDGRRQRGSAARSQRNSQSKRLTCKTLPSLEVVGAGGAGPIPHRRRGALATRP
jgi:hypothetical protein